MKQYHVHIELLAV